MNPLFKFLFSSRSAVLTANAQRALVASAVIFLLALPLQAKEPVQPELKQRYHQLLEELRCVVCQNQNIAESTVDLAVQLRAEVSTQLSEGASDQQIKDYLVERYGEFVLYQPRFSAKTAVMFIAPVILLLIALSIVLFNRRKLQSESLTDAEQAQLDALLAQAKSDQSKEQN